MFFQKSTFFALFVLFVESHAAPLHYKLRREVPQEHSHEFILRSVRTSLNLNNPAGIVDPVFGLLGNQAATQGLGQIQDPNCLQQATADQAFTNAKAAGDVIAMSDALIFRALERNSGAVGQKTELCTSLTAVNPEIAAIQQHQDPASDGAAATNKAIALELAKQLGSIGGDPQDAFLAGTFAPGQIGDNTGKGNTCNDENDADGCIFTLNLLVDDATAEELDAAGAGGATGGGQNNAGNAGGNNGGNAGNNNGGNAGNNNGGNAGGNAGNNGGNAGNNNGGNANNGAAVGNLQTFAGALGGATAPAVTAGGRGFVVENSDDFLNLGAALGRSCDIQKNKCADLSNSGQGDFSVGECDAQGNQCRANIQ